MGRRTLEALVVTGSAEMAGAMFGGRAGGAAGGECLGFLAGGGPARTCSSGVDCGDALSPRHQRDDQTRLIHLHAVSLGAQRTCSSGGGDGRSVESRPVLWPVTNCGVDCGGTSHLTTGLRVRCGRAPAPGEPAAERRCPDEPPPLPPLLLRCPGRNTWQQLDGEMRWASPDSEPKAHHHTCR